MNYSACTFVTKLLYVIEWLGFLHMHRNSINSQNAQTSCRIVEKIITALLTQFRRDKTCITLLLLMPDDFTRQRKSYHEERVKTTVKHSAAFLRLYTI